MSDRQMPVSMVLETNKGGVPVTICACGALLVILHGIDITDHTTHCIAYQRWEACQAAEEVQDDI